jgi:peptidoglycan/xylan/chitin deacetylase (PgdA/CDA1 family)
MEYAVPILDRLGVPAAMFAPTSFMGGGHRLVWPGIDHWAAGQHAGELAAMAWSDCRALIARGWEIGSHTVSHPRLTGLNELALSAELSRSREECTEQLGVECRTIAYPYGDVDGRVIAATQAAGYDAAARLSSDLGGTDPYSFPRAGIYRRDSGPRIWLKTARTVRQIRATPAWRRMRG